MLPSLKTSSSKARILSLHLQWSGGGNPVPSAVVGARLVAPHAFHDNRDTHTKGVLTAGAALGHGPSLFPGIEKVS